MGAGGPVRAWNADIISCPLYLSQLFGVSRLRAYVCGFLGDDSRNCFRILRSLFGSGYTYGVSLRSYGQNLTQFLRVGGLLEMTSGLSPYSALSLVR